MLRKVETLEKFWTVFGLVTGSEFLINEDDGFAVLVFETCDSCACASGNSSEALAGDVFVKLFEDIRDTEDARECSEMVMSDTLELIFCADMTTRGSSGIRLGSRAEIDGE